jgi:hypothetical protein
VACAKPAGDTIGGRQGEPDSGLVRFNAPLGLKSATSLPGPSWDLCNLLAHLYVSTIEKSQLPSLLAWERTKETSDVS